MTEWRLLPCPFCDRELVLRETGWGHESGICDCVAAHVMISSLDDAASWNTRYGRGFPYPEATCQTGMAYVNVVEDRIGAQQL